MRKKRSAAALCEYMSLSGAHLELGYESAVVVLSRRRVRIQP